jgi:DNA-binding NarL/FixJ family response regulator
MPLRVVIADDHQLILEGLRKIVEPHCEVIGTAVNGRDAVKMVLALHPELVLLDVAMPLLNGLECCRQIIAKDPLTKVIFVTMQLNRDFVREAFAAGASGYVLKQAAVTELITAINEVRNGRFFLSPTLVDLAPSMAHTGSDNPGKLFAVLTPRQRQVLQLVAEGKTAKEIAQVLSISVKTVEFHKKHLMQDLQLHNSSELVRYAVEQHWVQS